MSIRPDDLDVWVLAGQSNMEGCALLREALPPEERVWSFTSAGKWEIAQEPLHRLWESFTPVHTNFMRQGLTEEQNRITNEEYAALANQTRIIGAGLGLSFGIALAEALGRPVGLIPAAHGGTSLDQWSPALKGEGGNSLYGAMLERIKCAGGALRGILWYQGESDALGELARTYSQRFADWVAAVRADTGRPDLPVIAVQLGRWLAPACEESQIRAWDTVREAQRTLPETVPHTAVTSAIDLGLADGIHIGAQGLIRLGRRMARLARHLTEQPEVPAGPQVERLEYLENLYGMDVVKVVCRGVTRGWHPQHNIKGFQVQTPEGKPHPSLMVVVADADDADPTAIRVIINGALDDSARLGYGLGIDPCCTAVDEADMPLCAFLPRKVGTVTNL